jgi:DNA gyrase subunit B
LYGADDLTHLEGLDAVRKRPGMYIGSTDSRGVGHLVNEILDNSTDEGVGGHATKVAVYLHADGSVQVDDDGRGIPTDINAKSGLNGVELVLTRLHAGGKFGGSGYKTSGGLHGVGASAVNALSLRFDVTVKRAGKVHEISFQRGVPGAFDGPGPDAKFHPESGLRIVRKMKRGEASGTSIRYWYDARYFETGARLDVDAVRAKLRNTAFLVPGVEYSLRDDTAAEPVCSAKGCRNAAEWALRWNNPKLHTPDRRKTWLACAEHRDSLSSFLGARGFLRETEPFSRR